MCRWMVACQRVEMWPKLCRASLTQQLGRSSRNIHRVGTWKRTYMNVNINVYHAWSSRQIHFRLCVIHMLYRKPFRYPYVECFLTFHCFRKHNMLSYIYNIYLDTHPVIYIYIGDNISSWYFMHSLGIFEGNSCLEIPALGQQKQAQGNNNVFQLT